MDDELEVNVSEDRREHGTLMKTRSICSVGQSDVVHEVRKLKRLGCNLQFEENGILCIEAVVIFKTLFF